MAILKDTVHGLGPERIISDHYNIVREMEQMANRKSSILNIETPNVDIFRSLSLSLYLYIHVYIYIYMCMYIGAIIRRGGLKTNGPDMLWVI